MIHVCGIRAPEESAEIGLGIPEILEVLILYVDDDPLISADILKVDTVENQRAYKENVPGLHLEKLGFHHHIYIPL